MSFLVDGANYNQRKKLTFGTAAILFSDLPNQTSRVHLDNTESDFWDNSPPVAGGGVRFADASGTILYDFQVESYDTIGDNGWWHVEFLHDAAADTAIYIYFDVDVETDGSNKEGTWDSNYKGVYHHNQNQTEGAFDDATVNNNNETNIGTTDVAAQIDRGRNFDGINDRLRIGDAVDAPASLRITGDMTVEAWINTTISTGNHRIIGRDDGSTDRDWFFQLDVLGRMRFGIWVGGILRSIIGTTTSVDDGLPHHVVAYNDEDGDLVIFVDGELEATGTGLGGTIDNDPVAITVGATDGDTLHFGGWIDEVTLSDDVVRSDDWIKARYQSGLGAWLTIGPAESEGVEGFLVNGGIVGSHTVLGAPATDVGLILRHKPRRVMGEVVSSGPGIMRERKLN